MIRPTGHCCWDYCGAVVHVKANRWFKIVGIVIIVMNVKIYGYYSML